MVRGAMVLRPAGPVTADALFAACPQATIRQPGGWVERLLTIGRRMLDGVPLETMITRPTDALLEGLSVLADARREVQAFERERAEREAGR
jgi:hypothetical protein